MEREDEIAGIGNVYSTANRTYDSRIARWFSLDPERIKFPNKSAFASFGNNPILYIDPDGDDYEVSIDHHVDPNTQRAKITISAGITSGNSLTDNVKWFNKQVQNAATHINTNEKAIYVVTQNDGTKIEYEVVFDVKVLPDPDKYKGKEGILTLNTIIEYKNKDFLALCTNQNLKTTIAGFQSDTDIVIREAAEESRVTTAGIFAIIKHEIGHTVGLIHPYYDNDNTNMNKDNAGVRVNNQEGKLFWSIKDILIPLGKVGIGKAKDILNNSTWYLEGQENADNNDKKYKNSTTNGTPIVDGQEFYEIKDRSTIESGTAPDNFENGELIKYYDIKNENTDENKNE